MTQSKLPATLLELAGASLTPSRLADACLIIIDIQNEYTKGPLKLPAVEPAIAAAARLLEAARNAGTPVFHVAHRGNPGGLFDRNADRGQIISAIEPAATEVVVEKALPNAFAGTSLKDQLESTGRKELIICGFMTHMCVSSTARAALDLDYRITIDADSCATRDLPDGSGGAIDAATVHTVSLAGLSDRFAVIARNNRWV